MPVLQLERWYQSKRGLMISFVLEVLAIYGFGSLAIANGNLWCYVLVLVLLVASLQNLIRLTRKLIHGRLSAKA